jgi:uncharacterized protein YkwD
VSVRRLKSDNSRRIYRRVLPLAACVLALATPVALAGGQGGSTPAPTFRGRVTAEALSKDVAGSVDELERLVVDAINEERASNGLPRLAESADLRMAARSFSRDMAEARFFGHIDPSGQTVSDRIERVGIGDWKNVGENIARNRGFRDPAHAAVRDWMKSEPHRDNILNTRFRETGVGIWIGPDRTFYFTQIFLVRKK